MAFSPDARYLAVQYGGPEWNLALWTWEKARMAGSVRTSTSSPIRQVQPQQYATAGANGQPSGRCVGDEPILPPDDRSCLLTFYNTPAEMDRTDSCIRNRRQMRKAIVSLLLITWQHPIFLLALCHCWHTPVLLVLRSSRKQP